MKNLTRLFDFYITASIHVSISVCCLSFITLYELQIPFQKELLPIIFCSTVVSYNFVKYGFLFLKKAFHKNYKNITLGVFTFVCGIIFCIECTQLNLRGLFVLIIIIILSLLYTLPLLPNQRNFRSLATLKIIMVALCWALLTVIFPIVSYSLELSKNEVIMTLQRFLLVIVLIFPFDIRDLKTDAQNLHTFPQLIGIRNTQWLGTFLLIIWLLLLFFRENIDLYGILTYIVTAFLTGWGVWFATEDSSKYYCSFWIESIPIIWFLLYILPYFL